MLVDESDCWRRLIGKKNTKAHDSPLHGPKHELQSKNQEPKGEIEEGEKNTKEAKRARSVPNLGRGFFGLA